MASDPQQQEESIGDLVGRVVEDTKAYAAAEIGYYRALASERLGEATNGLWLGVVALLLVNGAAIALVVGLILILARPLGPIWATLIVVLVAAGVAALLGWLAWRKLKHVFADLGARK